jgi:hypothetical protein
MPFKGREQMEREMNTNETTNTTRNVNSATVSEVSEISDKISESIDDEENASSQFGATGRKKRRTNNGLTSSIRRIGKAIKVSKQKDYIKKAQAEIDTRADTLCAGSTIILHETTGKIVDVQGFHESLDIIKGIQIGKSVTAIDLEGETIIASFPQRLYFGDTP